MSKKAIVDTLRSLAHGSISASYAAIGSAITQPIRLFCVTNNTNGDMLFSLDGSTDQLFVAQGSFKLFDVASNRDDQDGYLALPANTTFYVKQSTAPSSGSVYVEIVYGN